MASLPAHAAQAEEKKRTEASVRAELESNLQHVMDVFHEKKRGTEASVLRAELESNLQHVVDVFHAMIPTEAEREAAKDAALKMSWMRDQQDVSEDSASKFATKLYLDAILWRFQQVQQPAPAAAPAAVPAAAPAAVPAAAPAAAAEQKLFVVVGHGGEALAVHPTRQLAYQHLENEFDDDGGVIKVAMGKDFDLQGYLSEESDSSGAEEFMNNLKRKRKAAHKAGADRKAEADRARKAARKAGESTAKPAVAEVAST